MRWVGPIVILGLLAYLATGLTVVPQDEVGVVRRFGAVLRDPWGPGLHWGLPWGCDRVDRIKTGQARVLTVGARGDNAAPLSVTAGSDSGDFLTGDLNLVSAQVVLQYRVRDPSAFLFSASSLETALAFATESALTQALAGRGVDDVLTTGRSEVAVALGRAIQEQSDREGLGITIVAARLGRVAPPAPVAPAFADAARARSDRRQLVTQAEEYRDRAGADARGQVREIADRAAARHTETTQRARGEAERFLKVQAESHKDPAATRQRLYLEALAELVPRFRHKLIAPEGQDLDLGLIEDAPDTRPKP
jgi:membrane protease subunit HflK